MACLENGSRSLALAARLQQYLAQKGLPYQEIDTDSAADFSSAALNQARPATEVLETQLLIGPEGVVLAVYGFGAQLDQKAVEGVAGRQLQPLTPEQATKVFSDCDQGFIPPIGAAYGVPVLVDTEVARPGRAVFCSGINGTLISMDRQHLAQALAGAKHGRITVPKRNAERRVPLTIEEVANQLQKLYRLPPMPALALRILNLTSNTDANARELSDLIELDPSLAAQVMRYARSALFNYPGQINSVHEAVTRVLGFDRVAHIALGIVSVKAFDVPRSGWLGVDNFWRHSLYCAFLCQSIAAARGGDRALAYLCGLLHNFGLLLIGHLFPQEYQKLCELRESEPEASMSELEQQVFGGASRELLSIGHGAIGGILHRLWQLPDPVVRAAGMHQRSDYQGDHEDYVLTVQLANGLLKARDIGDEHNPDDLAGLLDRLGLPYTATEDLNQEIDRVAADLDALASSLAP